MEPPRSRSKAGIVVLGAISVVLAGLWLAAGRTSRLPTETPGDARPSIPSPASDGALSRDRGTSLPGQERVSVAPPPREAEGPAGAPPTEAESREAERMAGEMGFTFTPIGAVVPLMESYRYEDLVRVVMAAKSGLPSSACVHLFGAGHPVMFALAVAMGCDLFDSAAYALYAKEGRYLTTHGSKKLAELSELPCSCEVCRGHSADEMRKSPEKIRLLARHNLIVTLTEISRIRQAISDGVLWELVDERCRSHPQLLRGYRTLLTYAEELATRDRISKRRFFYRGDESCRRTEVLRYQMMIPRFSVGPKVLVTFDRIPSGGVPGYDTVLLFRPPFGPYPVELKETFPIGQCELPEWDDHMVISGCRGIRALFEANPGISVTVRCGPGWASLVSRELPEVRLEQR